MTQTRRTGRTWPAKLPIRGGAVSRDYFPDARRIYVVSAARFPIHEELSPRMLLRTTNIKLNSLLKKLLFLNDIRSSQLFLKIMIYSSIHNFKIDNVSITLKSLRVCVCVCVCVYLLNYWMIVLLQFSYISLRPNFSLIKATCIHSCCNSRIANNSCVNTIWIGHSEFDMDRAFH